MSGFAGLFVAGGAREEELLSRVSPMARALAAGAGEPGRVSGAASGGVQGSWLDPDVGVALVAEAPITATGAAGASGLARRAGGRYSLAFAGDLYNRGELESELAGEGVDVRGGDAAVVLGAFEHWGIEAGIRRLQGPFALAVWDMRERVLHLIRDHLGMKPLFVRARGGVVSFGSRLRALAAGPGFEREVDRRSLCHYLRYLYVPAPHCIYRGIDKIRQGHILTISDPAAPLPAARAYWSLREVAERGLRKPFRGTLHDAADEVERILGGAVRARLGGEVPVGALLSGGIDSTSVVALMSEYTTRPIRTFVASYAEAEYNEAAHAARIAEHLGTEHTEFRIGGEDARAVIPKLAEIFDEPYADAGALPAYLTAALARQEVEIAFVGDGGDEIFGGYNRYTYGEKVVRRLGRLPRPARRLVAAGIASIAADSWTTTNRALAPVMPAQLRQRLAGEKLAKIGRILESSNATTMYRSLLSAWHDPSELVPGGYEEMGELEEVLDAESPARLVDRMMLADQIVYLPDDQLAKAEQVALAARLRMHSPILDHQQVEFSWTLPIGLKIDAGRGKLPLREIIYRRLPRELIDRPKMGFSVPLADWLRGPLRPWAEELLAPAALARDGLLRPEPILTAWHRLQRGRTELALSIWAVLVLQLWRDRWL